MSHSIKCIKAAVPQIPSQKATTDPSTPDYLLRNYKFIQLHSIYLISSKQCDITRGDRDQPHFALFDTAPSPHAGVQSVRRGEHGVNQEPDVRIVVLPGQHNLHQRMNNQPCQTHQQISHPTITPSLHIRWY